MLKVFRSPSTGWHVERRIGEQPFVFPTKAQAITFSISFAQQRQPCEIHVHDLTGNLERVITFPEGAQCRAARSDRRRAQIDIAFPDRRAQERRAYQVQPQR